MYINFQDSSPPLSPSHTLFNFQVRLSMQFSDCFFHFVLHSGFAQVALPKLVCEMLWNLNQHFISIHCTLLCSISLNSIMLIPQNLSPTTSFHFEYLSFSFPQKLQILTSHLKLNINTRMNTYMLCDIHKNILHPKLIEFINISWVCDERDKAHTTCKTIQNSNEFNFQSLQSTLSHFSLHHHFLDN